MKKHSPKPIDLLHYRRVMIELVELVWSDMKQIIVLEAEYDRDKEEILK